MKIDRTSANLHPLLIDITARIQREVIDRHNIPIRLFETSRTTERHQKLIDMRKTHDAISRHLYDTNRNPPLYATAVDYVYYDGAWSWNIRNASIKSWYILFGNLVLDMAPELEWGAFNRSSTNYCHFQLRELAIRDNIKRHPCVIP